MTSLEIVVKAFHCERCEYVWIPRILSRPKSCPQCHSRIWDKKIAGEAAPTAPAPAPTDNLASNQDVST